MTYTHTPWFTLEIALFVSVVALPFSAHAGFFSKFFDTANAEVESPAPLTQDTNMQTMPLLRAAIHIDPNPAKGGGDILVEDGALVPLGDVDGKDTKNSMTGNGEINQYVVREGDTLSQIAEMFDVSAKTILWANDISNPSKIRPGDSLIILPITGVRHVVKKGDTIASIAKKYEGDIDDILAYNQLASAEGISVGDTIVIPGGVMAQPVAPKKSPSSSYAKGTAVSKGNGSAGYSHPAPGAVRTQGLHGYNGVDFGAPVGTPIYAAAAGEVIVSKSSGYNGGYGLYVVVKHANGTQTLYAHNSRNVVAVGDTVSAGQVIGYIGNTGRSTGPHLHFEVRGARNPF